MVVDTIVVETTATYATSEVRMICGRLLPNQDLCLLHDAFNINLDRSVACIWLVPVNSSQLKNLPYGFNLSVNESPCA